MRSLPTTLQRASNRYPTVILTSGYSEVLAEKAHIGFDLIQKPYSVESPFGLLRKAIERPEAHGLISWRMPVEF